MTSSLEHKKPGKRQKCQQIFQKQLMSPCNSSTTSYFPFQCYSLLFSPWIHASKQRTLSPLKEQWFNLGKATTNHNLDSHNFPLPLSSSVEVMVIHPRHLLSAGQTQTIQPDGPSHHGVLQSHEKKACFVFADLKMDLCCGDKYRKVIRLLICH